MAENSNKIAIKTMASRIVVVNVIKDLKTSSENLKTKKKYNFFGVIKEMGSIKAHWRRRGDIRGSRT